MSKHNYKKIWTTAVTLRFIRLFKPHESLWNPRDKNFGNENGAVYKMISEKLDIPVPKLRIKLEALKEEYLKFKRKSHPEDWYAYEELDSFWGSVDLFDDISNNSVTCHHSQILTVAPKKRAITNSNNCFQSNNSFGANEFAQLAQNWRPATSSENGGNGFTVPKQIPQRAPNVPFATNLQNDGNNSLVANQIPPLAQNGRPGVSSENALKAFIISNPTLKVAQKSHHAANSKKAPSSSIASHQVSKVTQVKRPATNLTKDTEIGLFLARLQPKLKRLRKNTCITTMRNIELLTDLALSERQSNFN